MTEDIRIDTLGKFSDEGYRFDLWCPHCQRGKTVSPDRFVAKLGADHPIDVARYVRCGVCGKKGIEVRIRPPTPELVDRVYD